MDKGLASTLSVIRGLSRADNPDSQMADEAFKALRPVILKRDNFQCRGCGFIAQKYQEVHHWDGNHEHNVESNLVTACRLCHLCEHIGWVGTRNAGTLILCPEISQTDLNQLQRILWVGKRGVDPDIRQLEELWSFQEQMELEAGFSNPLTLANELIAWSDDDYANRNDVIGNIRLLFHEREFEAQISYWTSSILHSMPTEKWVDITCQHLELEPVPQSA